MDMHGCIYGSRLYFTSSIGCRRFGAINIESHEIEFIQEIETDAKPISIQYCNSKLYILDSDKILRIYEE